jgi:hypothetical protein
VSSSVPHIEEHTHLGTCHPDLRSLWEVERGERGDNWRIMDGLILIDGCLYIPAGSPSAHAVLHSAHGVGHEGIAKMLRWLLADFTYRACTPPSRIMCTTARFARGIKPNNCRPLSSFVPLSCPQWSRQTLAWTSSRGSRASMARQSCSPSSTASQRSRT